MGTSCDPSGRGEGLNSCLVITDNDQQQLLVAKKFKAHKNTGAKQVHEVGMLHSLLLAMQDCTSYGYTLDQGLIPESQQG